MVENTSPFHDLGPMELFLMAAISRGGLNSLYMLQRGADIQPGSIRSALRGLEKSGLLTRQGAEKRGRRVMVLTEAGKDMLAERWTSCLDSNREIESLLRSATVAVLMGEVCMAIKFLLRSSAERSSRLGPEDNRPYFTDAHPIDLHAEMRAIYTRQRRAMEAELLHDIAKRLRGTVENMDLGNNMTRSG